LILIDSAGIFYPGVEEQGKEFLVRNTEDVRHLLSRMWYRMPWYFRFSYSAILKELQHRAVPEFIQSIRELDFLNNSLPNLKIPIDVVWGENDHLIPKASINILKYLIPDLQTHFIPNCGHVPQLERPRETIFLLNRILRSYDG